MSPTVVNGKESIRNREITGNFFDHQTKVPMYHLPLMVEKNIMPSSLAFKRGISVPILNLPLSVVEDTDEEEEYEEEEVEEESIFDSVQEHWNEKLDRFLENERDEEQATAEIENLLVNWKRSMVSKTKFIFPSNEQNLTPCTSENSQLFSMSSEAKTSNINSLNSRQNLNDTTVPYRRYHPIDPLVRVGRRLEFTSSSSSLYPDFPSPHFVLPTGQSITPASDVEGLGLMSGKNKQFLSEDKSFQTTLHPPLSCSSSVTRARPTATDQSGDAGHSDATWRDSVHCFSHLWTRDKRYDCLTSPPSPSVPLSERRVPIHKQRSKIVLRSISFNSLIKARYGDLHKCCCRIRKVLGNIY